MQMQYWIVFNEGINGSLLLFLFQVRFVFYAFNFIGLDRVSGCGLWGKFFYHTTDGKSDCCADKWVWNGRQSCAFAAGTPVTYAETGNTLLSFPIAAWRRNIARTN